MKRILWVVLLALLLPGCKSTQTSVRVFYDKELSSGERTGITINIGN